MSALSSLFFVRELAALLGACAAIACKSEKAVTPKVLSSAEPAASGSSPTTITPPPAALAPAASARPSGCVARKPFVSAGDPASERRLALPAPFQSFDACAALTAIFPDYDSSTERSTQAGGVVRARNAGLFLHGGRELLVLIDYRGKEAEEELVGGCDPFHGHVSLLARSADGKQLALVARGTEPVAHTGVGSAIEVGIGTSASLALRENDPALVLRSEHGCGTAPARTAAHVLVLEGAVLRPVLDAASGARGLRQDNEIHELRASLTPKPRGKADKNGFADLTLGWTDMTCPYDENGGADHKGDFVCGQAKPLGTDTYRYDGRAYVRRGRATKVPFL